MSIRRKLVQIEAPEAEPGFLGKGHTARPVIRSSFAQSDPFIMLMDDVLDKKDNEPVGGPHPHAGFETATLVLEGELGGGNHRMKEGDFQMMTAGSGIIHTETIDKALKMRVLQLWVSLPRKDRWTTPRVQDIPLEHVPQLSRNGVSIKLYSGSFAGLVSPVQNYAPVIIADVSMDPGTSGVQQIPASYNTFIYVLRGSVRVGDERSLKQDQVGWLDVFKEDSQSELELTAGEEGTRFVLYAGKPTGDKIVPYGPFVADSPQDIARLFHEYKQGNMQHISTVPEHQRIML